MPLSYMSQFDSLTRFRDNGLGRSASGAFNPMVFTGPIAAAVFGKEVDVPNVDPAQPISSQNFYHLGGCDHALLLRQTLMNGCSAPAGSRNHLTDIDLAVFTDMGYKIIR